MVKTHFKKKWIKKTMKSGSPKQSLILRENQTVPYRWRPNQGGVQQLGAIGTFPQRPPGGRTCGTPLWVSTAKEHFPPIYGLFCQPTKRGALVFFCLFQLLDLTSPPSRDSPRSADWVLLPLGKPFKTTASTQSTSVCWETSHTMENMLKDFNHSPTYQHTKKQSFVISLLWINWDQP